MHLFTEMYLALHLSTLYERPFCYYVIFFWHVYICVSSCYVSQVFLYSSCPASISFVTICGTSRSSCYFSNKLCMVVVVYYEFMFDRVIWGFVRILGRGQPDRFVMSIVHFSSVHAYH